MRKMLLAAWGGLCLAFSMPANAHGLSAHHESFTLYGEGGEGQMQAMAQDLARYDAALRQLFSVSSQEAQNPLDIFLVAKPKDAGRLATGQGGSDVAGWYSRHAEGSYVLASQAGWSAEPKSVARSVLLHEYTHHFLNRYDDEAMPAWLSEGRAEFYSTMTFDGSGRAVVGQVPAVRAGSMARKNQLPIEALLFSSPLELTNHVQREQFYNRAWLLVHMAEFRPEWGARLAQFRAALLAGADQRVAAEAFGDLGALNAALDVYAASALASRSLDLSGAAAGVRLTPLSAPQAEIIGLRMERNAAGRSADRLGVAYRKAGQLAARYPNEADAQFELAKTGDALRRAMRDRGPDAAALRAQIEQALERSLSLRGDHSAANLLSGLAAMDDLRMKGSSDPAAWQDVRAKIRLAMQNDSGNPMALKAYYESYIGERRTASKEAVRAVARAFALAPELPSVRTAYAWSLARDGDLAGAERVIQKLARDPQDNGSAAMLSVQFAGMRQLAKASA